MNIYERFKDLLPGHQMQVGTVDSHTAVGSSIILLPTGRRISAIGTSVPVGQAAYIQDQRVIGPAPSLPVVPITIPGPL